MTDALTGHGQPTITIFTMGFAKKNAQEFFETLQRVGVRRLVDIRLNNVSQLAGFTKKMDLAYFLRVIANIDYAHIPDLAPTKDILDDYRKKRIDWAEYERRYNQVLQERKPENYLNAVDFDKACLLCSEVKADQCHRRLACEYLRAQWGNVAIEHL